MDTADIDKVKDLIKKYDIVMSAKNKIESITGKYGGDDDDFVLTDKDSGTDIFLFGLKSESINAINGVLNDQYDKIVSRLREI